MRIFRKDLALPTTFQKTISHSRQIATRPSLRLASAYAGLGQSPGCLTMRLSDAGFHQRQTKALYLNHRLPSLAHRSCAPRSLEPIVRFQTALPLKQLLKLLTRELEVSQNARQEPGPKRLPGVNRNHRGAAVTVTDKMMTAFDSHHNESDTPQRRNEVLTLNGGERGHAPTVTRCTPIKSSVSAGLP